MEEEEDKKGRMIAVRLPRKYYRAIRRWATQHETTNAEVLVWAMDALEGTGATK